jgi:hypothetical protein
MSPNMVLLLYALTAGVLVGVAGLWAGLRGLPFWPGGLPGASQVLLGVLAALALFVANLALYLLVRNRRWFQSVRDFFEEVLFPLILPMSLGQLLALSVMAGVAEELLFRGPMQRDLGLLLAALLFGAVHTYSPRLWFYGLWVAVIGVIMGLLLRQSGNLITPVVAHGLYDFLSLLGVKLVWGTRHGHARIP